MRTQNKSSVNHVHTVFSTRELEVIAKICSLDSMTIQFDPKQIERIQSKDNFIWVFFKEQGAWMMTIATVKRLKTLAETHLELEEVMELHAQSLTKQQAFA